MFAYQGVYHSNNTVPPLSWSLQKAWDRLSKLLTMSFQPKPSRDEARRSRAISNCSFTQSKGKGKRRGRRAPSMLKAPSTSLVIPPLVGSPDTFTIVLDLDETLAFGRQGPVVKRPFLDEFLSYLATLNCEVVVWTAGVRSYAQRLVTEIDQHGVIQHCIYRHDKWYPRSPYECYTKNLTLTGRHPDRTLIIDNTPDCMIRNASNGIVCSDFVGHAGNDLTLLALRDLIGQLVLSRATVPKFVSESTDLRLLPVTDHRGDVFYCYFLDQSKWGGPGLDTDEVRRKTNRDWLIGMQQAAKQRHQEHKHVPRTNPLRATSSSANGGAQAPIAPKTIEKTTIGGSESSGMGAAVHDTTLSKARTVLVAEEEEEVEEIEDEEEEEVEEESSDSGNGGYHEIA